MGLKSDAWIRKMSVEQGMITPFEEKLIRETGLAPGDRLDRSDLFPVIWRRGPAMTTRSPEPATATT